MVADADADYRATPALQEVAMTIDYPEVGGGGREYGSGVWVSPGYQSSPLSCILSSFVLLPCLFPTLSRPLDPGRAEEVPGLPVPLEARKKNSVYACVGCLLRREYHSEVRDTTMTLMVHGQKAIWRFLSVVYGRGCRAIAIRRLEGMID